MYSEKLQRKRDGLNDSFGGCAGVGPPSPSLSKQEMCDYFWWTRCGPCYQGFLFFWGGGVVETDQARAREFKARRGAGKHPKFHKPRVMRFSFNHLLGTTMVPRFMNLLCQIPQSHNQINLLRNQTIACK